MITLNPGIGIIKHKLEQDKDAISLATSIMIKKYNKSRINVLETKYDYNSGEWYVALSIPDKKMIVRLNSLDGKLLGINEISNS